MCASWARKLSDSFFHLWKQICIRRILHYTRAHSYIWRKSMRSRAQCIQSVTTVLGAPLPGIVDFYNFYCWHDTLSLSPSCTQRNKSVANSDAIFLMHYFDSIVPKPTLLSYFSFRVAWSTGTREKSISRTPPPPPFTPLRQCWKEQLRQNKLADTIFFFYPETHTSRSCSGVLFLFHVCAVLMWAGREAEEAPSYSKKRVERNLVAMGDRADQLGPEQPLSGSW